MAKATKKSSYKVKVDPIEKLTLKRLLTTLLSL